MENVGAAYEGMTSAIGGALNQEANDETVALRLDSHSRLTRVGEKKPVGRREGLCTSTGGACLALLR